MMANLSLINHGRLMLSLFVAVSAGVMRTIRSANFLSLRLLPFCCCKQ